MATTRLGNRVEFSVKNTWTTWLPTLATTSDERRRRSLSFFGVALVLLVVGARAESSVEVETFEGKIIGYRQNSSSLVSFLGIPYGADTAGENRWRPPQDPEPYFWDKPLDAREFGPSCPQDAEGLYEGFERLAALTGAPEPSYLRFNESVQSEECLFLNVFTPSVNGTKPVLVWVYGGDLTWGRASDYLPGGLLRDVVLVTFNYRVGAFGYFAHPSLTEGTNLGLLDQIKALEWVRDNIDVFGGDPDNVVVFGESAGGSSVAALLVSPATDGELFKGAIMQSADFSKIAPPGVNMSVVHEAYIETGVAMGAPKGPDQLQSLRRLPTSSILKEWPATRETIMYMDDVSLSTPFFQAVENGDNMQVPILVGTNEDDGSLFVNANPWPLLTYMEILFPPGKVTNSEQYESLLAQVFKGRSKDLLEVYPSKNLTTSIENMFTDATFAAPAYEAARMWAQQGLPSYLYLFKQPPPPDVAAVFGVPHGADLPYVWGGQKYLFKGAFPFPVTSEALMGDIQEFWKNFASKGNPNGDGLATWSTFKEAGGTNNFALGSAPAQEPIPRLEGKKILMELYGVFAKR
ncbi:carboxylic ester hydrolase [Chloropicon primus]|uniref:Carboxylic ester hydrolase n=1 Tax=Chloropicon primus TaxID=1764295 RepID=A0A5B8MV74_9CHLO|nr:carboxylic ester hydrolase [Chloropicon primus]UPR02522.1 carboxylic ester hydrolase [Chloropicon primus]|eukprot:QDZ23310.1 carboxylic ester hydrolase [Chloropicon primus]